MPLQYIKLHVYVWVRMKLMFDYAKLHKHFCIPSLLGNSRRASTGAGGNGRYLPSCFRFSQRFHHSNQMSCKSFFVVVTVTRECAFELLIYDLFISEVCKCFIEK
jgi:hypothetical protein